jgi:hypothetical protein
METPCSCYLLLAIEEVQVKVLNWPLLIMLLCYLIVQYLVQLALRCLLDTKINVLIMFVNNWTLYELLTKKILLIANSSIAWVIFLL